jgi:hypothetical protein
MTIHLPWPVGEVDGKVTKVEEKPDGTAVMTLETNKGTFPVILTTEDLLVIKRDTFTPAMTS